MNKQEFLYKIFNETEPRRPDKVNAFTIWELMRQGEFIIESDKTRFKFYDTFYNRLNAGEQMDEEKVAALSYKLREEAGEI
jgi:hypothetical protein